MAIDPARLLRDWPEEQIGISIPTPLSARLDSLVERADEVGEVTTRKELLSALLLDAPADGDALSKLIRTYRRARARDAVPSGVDPADILGERERKPGRRARRADSSGEPG
jgi:hypothetical protein